MDVTSLVEAWGGVTTYATLRGNSSRQEIRAAVEAGALVIDGRGRYALPYADAALRQANAASAVLSHRSAAAH